MNDPSQHEFDDELLSAYLDDELSADERALVEIRLAADPAARQTLAYLRSVSQTVRDLPTQAFGRDLRESILQRAQTARVARPESAKGMAPSPQPRPQLPAVTIGRTARGWVWATAAIAAAMLIMVLQPREDQDANLPNVALNKNSREETTKPANRQLAEQDSQERLAQRDAALATAAAEPMPSAAPASTAQDFSVSGQARVTTAPASESTTTSDQLGSAPAPPQLRDGMAEEMPAAGATAIGASGPPVVVRVLAKRASVDGKAFDALLRKNNVDVEPADDRLAAEGDVAFRGNSIETSAPVEAPPADAVAKSESETAATTDGSPVAAAARHGSSAAGVVDFVLVDAPVDTIFACLNDLNTDAKNFTGISVDETTQADNTPAADKIVQTQRTSELARFNRGTVPRSPDALADVDYYQYLDDDRAKQHPQPRYFAESSDVGGGVGGAKSDRGRARRLQQRAAESSEVRSSPADAKQLATAPAPNAKDKGRVAEQFGLTVTPAQDRMQVLFVIQPSDEPAPSLKAKNQAE